jgi:hypothetical protein
MKLGADPDPSAVVPTELPASSTCGPGIGGASSGTVETLAVGSGSFGGATATAAAPVRAARRWPGAHLRSSAFDRGAVADAADPCRAPALANFDATPAKPDLPPPEYSRG